MIAERVMYGSTLSRWTRGILLCIVVVALSVSVTRKKLRLGSAKIQKKAAGSSESNETDPIEAIKEDDRFSTVVGLKSGREYRMKRNALEQIEHYRDLGTGLMIEVHIDRKDGDYRFCNFIKSLLVHPRGVVPHFQCRGVTPRDNMDPDDYKSWGLILSVHRTPWAGSDTEANVQKVRKYFHMITQLYTHAPGVPLSTTNWEHPDVLSILVVRDPMEQMLAGASKMFPGFKDGTASNETFWDFADDESTDNFGLRVLSGNGCCNGSDTEPKHYVAAQELIKRFSIVLDAACLDAGFHSLADIFNYTEGPLKPRGQGKSSMGKLVNAEVYEYLLRKNRYNIELYNWAKTISLVNCNDLNDK